MDNFIKVVGYCDNCGTIVTNKVKHISYSDEDGKTWRMFCDEKCKLSFLVEQRLLGAVHDDTGRVI